MKSKLQTPVDNLTLEDYMETLEVFQDTVDELWKQTEVEPAYHEARMQHFIQIIFSNWFDSIHQNQTKHSRFLGWTIPNYQ